MSKTPQITVIVGSTGVGKTKLSLELARHLDGEIIGLDSVQIYNRLCIGSAKPSPTDLSAIKHHLIDTRDFYNPLKVRMYLLEVKRTIDEILSRQKHVIICGGSFFYLSQLLIPTHCSRTTIDDDGESRSIDQDGNEYGPLSNHPSFNPNFSPTALESDLGLALNPGKCKTLIEYRNSGFLDGIATEVIFTTLYKVDQTHALKHKTNRRRLVRGVEIFLEHGIGPTEVYRNQNGPNSGQNGPNLDQNGNIMNDVDGISGSSTANTLVTGKGSGFELRYDCVMVCLTSSVEL